MHSHGNQYLRENVLPAPDQHVLQPADYATVAILSQNELVARFQPTVFGQGLSGVLLVGPITHHRAVTANPKLAGSTERDDRSLFVYDLFMPS